MTPSDQQTAPLIDKTESNSTGESRSFLGIVGYTGFYGGCEHKNCVNPRATFLVDGKRLCERHAVRPVKPKSETGRNDPCPCGSGKKHKKCCRK